MKIMYIDESGDTIPISSHGKKYLVLTGCIMDEKDKHSIETSLRQIKSEFYQNPSIEIKSNFLRYANPDLKESSPLKLNDRGKYDLLESKITGFLKKIPISLISIVINKTEFWKKYPAQNPYNTAYVFLLERFQMYLQQDRSLGICIIDPREGQVEKHYIGAELDRVHDYMRWSTKDSDDNFVKCKNIIERILFSTSDKNIGIQIADLYCYPIFHIFEYKKKIKDYWRFHETCLPKLHNKNKRIIGYGLKVFPKISKKDPSF